MGSCAKVGDSERVVDCHEADEFARQANFQYAEELVHYLEKNKITMAVEARHLRPHAITST